jgi:hypothetical protein
MKRLRWECNVQIRKGDQFIDEKWLKYQQVKRDINLLENKGGNLVDQRLTVSRTSAGSLMD